MSSQELGSGSSALNCPSTESLSICPSGVEDPFYSFLQNEFSNPHYALENQTIGSSSHLKMPCFGSGNLPEMVTSFGCHSNFPQTQGVKFQNLEDGTSPKGKRKRKNVDVEQNKEQTSEFAKVVEEKKNTGANSKDNSNSKEDYIHVRAKRGQATNSHSLAERVRREKISERMRLLQELVPGCNKITGKAVMLDEIINYVQSLQQQVEFLSMKLATVNPELNVDAEHILSKDILHQRAMSLDLSSSHLFPGNLNSFPGAATSFHPLPQSLWNNNELQSLLQMGFDSNPSMNGLSKMEL